ncbi:MAG: carbohydrate kinase family protein [Burkholderiaceae bacterium]
MVSKPGVVVIGAANMDVAAHAAYALAPCDSTPGTVRHAPGGVARNVAENLARLGHAVALLSAVGNDAAGRELLRHTDAAGVDMRGCWVIEGQPTSSYVSLHGPDGDMLAAVNDMALVAAITPERLAASPLLAASAEALFIDANLSEAALQWLFAQRRPQAPIFADAVSAFKCRQLAPWLGRVHTLKANLLEAADLCGLPVQSDADMGAAVRWLHAQGVSNVVISLGARGAYGSFSDGTQCLQSAPPVQLVNSTGAGDALMAGLLHGHLESMPGREALRFGLGCAAMTLTALAANHPELSVGSVQRWLAPNLSGSCDQA